MIGAGQGFRLEKLLYYKAVLLQAVPEILNGVHIGCAARMDCLKFYSGTAGLGYVNKGSDKPAALMQIPLPAGEGKAVCEQILPDELKIPS